MKVDDNGIHNASNTLKICKAIERLFKAFALLVDKTEVAQFLTDLCTPTELQAVDGSASS